ncbi:hypothetical protein PG5_01040 [Pseudomonas sp. G5(2012)]|nr:hypothetical protein PG5_01040 [Pseudomonas sp. G5(2012)]
MVILYTSAVEQQLSIMPLFIIMGGKVEPYLVGLAPTKPDTNSPLN